MIQLDGTLKTDDMTLVAFVQVHGYTPKMERAQERQRHVYWVLSEDELDEFCEDLVQDFQSGAARIEPQRYARELRAVRERLYSFLGIKGQPVRA
jgi:regulator of sigma D